MGKRKVLYCSRCDEETVHNIVERDCAGAECGPIFRPFLAVCTLGVSEVTTGSSWECSKCGKTKEI